MAVNKTQKNEASVTDFIGSIDHDTRRGDAEQVLALMQRVTGGEPTMWGPSIVGFGFRTMTYESGRVVDWFDVGFSPRKQSLTLYIMDGFDEYQPLLDRLGSHTTGKSCLYIKRLDKVDLDVLEELVDKSVAHVRTLGE
jgi:hypothetical protein